MMFTKTGAQNMCVDVM